MYYGILNLTCREGGVLGVTDLRFFIASAGVSGNESEETRQVPRGKRLNNVPSKAG